MATKLKCGFDFFAFDGAQRVGWSAPFTSAFGSGRYGTGQSCVWGPGIAPQNNRFACVDSDGNLSPSSAHIFGGLAFNFLSVAAETPVLYFMDGATVQCGLTWDGTAGLLRLRLGAGTTGTVIAVNSTPYNLTSNDWHHIAWDIVLSKASEAAGIVHIAMDTTTDDTAAFSATGAITASTTVDRCTHVAFPAVSGAQVVFRFDDLYLNDDTGGTANVSMGDCRIYARVATGDGSHSDMTPSGPGTHFSKVNQTILSPGPFVASNVVGQIDTYQMGDIPAGMVIKSVQQLNAVAKDDAASRKIALVTRVAGMDYVGADFPLSSSIQYAKKMMSASPATGAAWTLAEFNAAEAGQKVTV